MTRWVGDVDAIAVATLTSPWTGPARVLALAVDAAVSSAMTDDEAGFGRANADLSRVDPEQLRTLLGHVSRELFERAHPDGLDSDDAEQALRSCAASAAGWYPQLDHDALVVALTGALGVSEPDDSPGPSEVTVVAHGLLLIADQLRTAGLRLEPILDSALRELMRSQTMEMP